MSSHVCESCGTVAKPKRHMKGSIIVELFMWMMLILPGVIYSLWRLTTKSKICGTCGSQGIVPVNTPRGQKLIQQFHAEEKAA
jgi:rRNA maturation endonuclease Nob1